VVLKDGKEIKFDLKTMASTYIKHILIIEMFMYASVFSNDSYATQTVHAFLKKYPFRAPSFQIFFWSNDVQKQKYNEGHIKES